MDDEGRAALAELRADFAGFRLDVYRALDQSDRRLVGLDRELVGLDRKLDGLDRKLDVVIDELAAFRAEYNQHTHE